MSQKELKDNELTSTKLEEKKANNPEDSLNENSNDPLLIEADRDSTEDGNEPAKTKACESVNTSEKNNSSNTLKVGKGEKLDRYDLKKSKDSSLTYEACNIPSSSPVERDNDVITARIKLGQEDDSSLFGADWSILYSRLNTLSSASTPSSSVGELPCNSVLNRYTNILPNDSTRVRLVGHAHTDYINANFVEVKRAGRRYVMTQGPLSHTSEQFWHMAWQTETPGIVMLNKILERNSEKCHPYYPNSQGSLLKFGRFKISCVSRECKYDYILSKLRVENLEIDDDSNMRFLTHFQYKTWPDFGVPASRAAFLTFLYSIRATGILDDSRAPPIIHCSAGVGRSGTFILIDSCLRMGELEFDCGDIDIEEVIVEMRGQRSGCIQSKEQLRFSYRCVVYGVENRGRFEERSVGDNNGLDGEVSLVKKSKRSCEELVPDNERGVKRQKQLEDGSILSVDPL